MTLKRLTQLVKGALNDYDLWSVTDSVQEGGLHLGTDDGDFFIEITKIDPDL